MKITNDNQAITVSSKLLTPPSVITDGFVREVEAEVQATIDQILAAHDAAWEKGRIQVQQRIIEKRLELVSMVRASLNAAYPEGTNGQQS